MSPVDKLAALRALGHGVREAQAEAEEGVREFRAVTRAKSFESDWGTVSFRANQPSLVYDQTKLLEWAREHMPHEIEPEHTVIVAESVRASLYKTLADRLEIGGGQVIDTQTGEIVDFASASDGSPDSVVFTMPRDKKADAARLVSDRIEALAAAVTPELTS